MSKIFKRNQIEKKNLFNLLYKIEDKLNIQTFYSFQHKIKIASRIDIIKKIENEILNFNTYLKYQKTGNFTPNKIKIINNEFNNLKEFFIDQNLDVDTYKLDINKLHNYGVENKNIMENILNFHHKIKNDKEYDAHERSLIMKINDDNNFFYTLNEITKKRLINLAENEFQMDYINSDNNLKNKKSDAIFSFEIFNNDNLTFLKINMEEMRKKKMEEKKNFYSKNEGDFFNYYVNENLKIDLKDFGIYTNVNEIINEIDKVCLIKALRIAGLDNIKYEQIKCFVKNGLINFSDIPKICELLKIQIKIKKPNQKNLNIFGKKFDEIYNIGLINKHYFLIQDTDYRYILEKHYNNKCLSNVIGISKIDKINSFQLIKFLFENKEKYLTKIPYDDLTKTFYYKKISDEITTLEYDKENCKLIENKEKNNQKIKYQNVFFDFETYTDENYKHVPYLCCIRWRNEQNIIQKKSFLGIDCGKQMLLYLNKSIKNNFIQLIAHNATYDYVFIARYLQQFSEIKRNNTMLSAQGKFFKKNYRIKCSYHLISCALNKFPKMFNLEEQVKEIIPYALYNEGFDFINNPMFKIDDVIHGKDKNGNRYVKEKDIVQFLNNIKKWNLEKDGYYNIIDYSQKYCEIDSEILMNGYEIFRSWILDLKYIKNNEYDDKEESNLNLDIDEIITAASLSHKFMIKNDVYDGIYELNGIPQRFIQKTIVGGRCMSKNNEQYHIKVINSNNEIKNKINNNKNYIETSKKIVDFDAVSLYPSSMMRLKGYLIGLPKIIKKENLYYEKLKKYDGYFVKVLIKNISKKLNFPLISLIDKKTGTRNFSNEIKNEYIYIDNIMLEDIIEFHEMKDNLDFEIIEGYYFDEGFNNKINKTIEYLFNKRLELKSKNNKSQEIYKLIMNSSYGKTIMKEQDSEIRYFYDDYDYNVFINRNYERIININYISESNIKRVEIVKNIYDHRNICHIGSQILSMSKRVMNEVICLCEDNNYEIYYQDTDSMHMYEDDIKKIEEKFYEKYNRHLIGQNMGQFHSDFEIDGVKNAYSNELIILGKKSYIDKLQGYDENNNLILNYHIRMKGIPNTTIDYEVLNQKFKNPINLYQSLFNGNKINFDLTENKQKSRFKNHKNISITTLIKFDRSLQF